MLNQPVIRFSNVSKKLDNKLVLKNISFEIYETEIFGLIGPSGSGKTTLLRSLIGFYKADSGDIIFKNQNITKNVDQIKKIFGFATQDNCFYEELTLLENLRYFGKLYFLSSKEIEERSEYLLRMVGLYESKDKEAGELSGGMKRRLDLACSLIHDPEILIMDEPTTGLDPITRKQIWRLIKTISASGTTIILSSHLLDEIEMLCSRVGVLSCGEIKVAGTTDQIRKMYSQNQSIVVETNPGNYHAVMQYLINSQTPITFYSIKNNKLTIFSQNLTQTFHSLLHILDELNERLIEGVINKPSFEEVFESIVKKNV